jgi:hypothetical protein
MMGALLGRGRWLNGVMAVLFAFTVAGCSTDDDEGEEPTQTAAPTATVQPSATAGSQGLVSGQAISDGICLAVIPDGWVDDGTGRGSTNGGGRFVLFGGSVASDAAWQAAVNVVATPTANRSIASLEQTADSIHVTFADGRGFEYRQRFGNRYCDLTVTRSTPFTPEEQAVWPAIIDTLAPVTQ